MKGFLVFCGLTVSIGLLAATLAYLDHHRKAHSSTLVDAIEFVEKAVEASQGRDVAIYNPSIEARSNPNRWTLRGLMVTQNPGGGTYGEPFIAVLEWRCDERWHLNCWRMEEFRLGGVRQSLGRGFVPNEGEARQDSEADRLARSLKRQMADRLARQRQMMDHSSEFAAIRASNIANAITRTGLDADRLVSSRIRSDLASGGPLIAAGERAAGPDPNTGNTGPLHGLNEHWDRLFAFQNILRRLPLAAPLKSYRISSPYGERTDPITGRWAYHSGLDLVGPLGSSVQATAPGTVTFAGRHGRYGNMIEIDHGHALSTRYGHLREILVQVGQQIGAGQTIAIMGNSGRSTGPHLHYEIRSQKRPLDPMKFLQVGAAAIGDDPELSTVDLSLWTGEPPTGALLLAD